MDSLQFSAFFGVCCFRPITWETSLTLIYNKIGLNSPSCSFLLLIAVLVTWMYWFLCQPLFLSQFLSCKLASLNAVPSVYFTKYIGMTLQFDLYILRLRNQAISGPKAIFCVSFYPINFQILLSFPQSQAWILHKTFFECYDWTQVAQIQILHFWSMAKPSFRACTLI